MKNAGKKFEDCFQDSVPDWCLTIRLPDPAAAFSGGEHTRFAVKNPCDYIVFDTIDRTLYCLELKSTKQKSISFEDINKSKQPKKMIHKHQIKGLLRFSKYAHVCAGFIFNFRTEVGNEERAYFQSIANFNMMTKDIEKMSFNENDLSKYGAIVINGKIKRVNYAWDIAELFATENILLR